MADRKLWFVHFAQWASHITGRPLTFMLALASIVVWAMLGPFFGFSDTWQLVINTATTIITFLMVFVIQNTQNRDTAAMHIKIDELIRVTQKARNVLLDLEELDDKTLELLRQDYEKLARKAKSHTSTPIRAEEVPGSPESREPARARPQMSETDKPGSSEVGLKAKPSHPKRFYDQVAIEDEGHGVALLLDGKKVRTPGKAPFLLPTGASGSDRRGMARAGRAHRSSDHAAHQARQQRHRRRDGQRGRGDRRHPEICRVRPSLLSRRRAEGAGRAPV